MEIIEAGRRHRRRGRGYRRKHTSTFDNLQPGRVPLGLRCDEQISNTNTLDLESDSESSEERNLNSFGFAITSSQPPSPTPKPLLTFRADTPMLGAQARAAELAAASAAKQRQVSRELEDRQLPPNPAISLSAFTKPQPTRNKGNKTWKPLVLDDIVESDDNLTSDSIIITTPKVDRLTAEEASEKKIPTGPRAMVEGRNLSTIVAEPQASLATDMATQGFGRGQGTMSLTDAPRYGSMMVPADMSPTKQEQKFSMLGNPPVSHLTQGRESSQFGQSQGMMQHDDPFSPRARQTLRNPQYLWGTDTYYPGYPLTFHGQTQHMGGGYDDDTDEAYSNQITQRKFPVEDPEPQFAQDRRNSGQLRESPLQYQEPYDTERAMKECKSKLKEKAKDGKTVLHNPRMQVELDRPTIRRASSDPRAPVPWEVRLRDSNEDANEWEVMPPPTYEINNNIANIKPAPGLPLPSTFGPPNLSFGSLKTESDGAPEIGSREWMRLAPITSMERDRVRRRMALAAKSLTNEVFSDDITTGQRKEDLAETRDWFYSDSRGERLLRQQVTLSAQTHASNVVESIRARNGGELPEGFQPGKDDGVAATLILGNVACNLQTYLVGDRKSAAQRRNFHKVKTVPDWCTERGGGMAMGSGVGGGDSYFDGVSGGFHGAPVRVARDPRFRPHFKEGQKVKPEEEWKNRHEMYGRRIM